MTDFPSENSQADATAPAAAVADNHSADTTEQAPRRSPWRKRSAIIAAIAVPVLVASGAGVAHAHKSVSIDVDGKVQQISTFAGSVKGALDTNNITVGEYDVVSPDPNAALTEGAQIVVRTAKPIEVTIDGATHTIWTTADDTAGALAELAASGRSASIVAASRSSERQELKLPLITDGTVTIVDGGESKDVPVTGIATLEDVLKQAEITLGEHDEVKITPKDANHVTVTIDRVAIGERSETEEIAFETVEKKTDALDEGQTKVVIEGKAGAIVRTYKTTTVNGKETNAELIDEQRTEPTTKVVNVGTKAKPKPSKSSDSKQPPATGGAPSSGVWAALAQCESGGNPRAVSASGTYHGLYQFSVATWRAVGGSGLPSQASPAEQTMRAQILQKRSGWGQWPACSAKLGLR
ncbi:resuscitation-promoting factor [Bowdeniella nasicola]|uniref:resuscitation-promoting factor n=1 Tax=Bowdeniella nasicola TaxID=208480 RepID=UPI0009F93BA5|nr:resuscitation-promoting factor [Bowdeniella nasicola]